MCVCGVFMLRINSTTRWPSVTTIQCAFTINSGEILFIARTNKKRACVTFVESTQKKITCAQYAKTNKSNYVLLDYYWTKTSS